MTKRAEPAPTTRDGVTAVDRAGLARRGPDRRFALGSALLRPGIAYRRSLRREPRVAPPLAELGEAPQRDVALVGVPSLSGLRSRFERADLDRRRALVVAAAHRLSISLGAPAGTETSP